MCTVVFGVGADEDGAPLPLVTTDVVPFDVTVTVRAGLLLDAQATVPRDSAAAAATRTVMRRGLGLLTAPPYVRESARRSAGLSG
jgi:hypothetical protein